MLSKVLMICDAYEAGIRRGMQQDCLDFSTPSYDDECEEAYQAGKLRGIDQYDSKAAMMLDRQVLISLGDQSFNEVVDCDFNGNPITNYDVLLRGAYGPAVARLCNLVLAAYGSSNVQFPIPEDDTGVDQQIQASNRQNGPAADTARKALFALFLVCPDDIAQDVTTKVYAAFDEIAER